MRVKDLKNCLSGPDIFGRKCFKSLTAPFVIMTRRQVTRILNTPGIKVPFRTKLIDAISRKEGWPFMIDSYAINLNPGAVRVVSEFMDDRIRMLGLDYDGLLALDGYHESSLSVTYILGQLQSKPVYTWKMDVMMAKDHILPQTGLKGKTLLPVGMANNILNEARIISNVYQAGARMDDMVYLVKMDPTLKEHDPDRHYEWMREIDERSPPYINLHFLIRKEDLGDEITVTL